jgi:hypothetical protein
MERVITDKCQNCRLTKEEHFVHDGFKCRSTIVEQGLPDIHTVWSPVVYLDEREVQAERVRIAKQLKELIYLVPFNGAYVRGKLLSLVSELEGKKP